MAFEFKIDFSLLSDWFSKWFNINVNINHGPEVYSGGCLFFINHRADDAVTGNWGIVKSNWEPKKLKAFFLRYDKNNPEINLGDPINKRNVTINLHGIDLSPNAGVYVPPGESDKLALLFTYLEYESNDERNLRSRLDIPPGNREHLKFERGEYGDYLVYFSIVGESDIKAGYCKRVRIRPKREYDVVYRQKQSGLHQISEVRERRV